MQNIKHTNGYILMVNGLKENNMNWEHNLQKLQELQNHLLSMLSPGRWQCKIPGEIGGDGLLKSEFEIGRTPSEAVNKAYNLVVNLPQAKYLVTTGFAKPRKCYKLYNNHWVQISELRVA